MGKLGRRMAVLAALLAIGGCAQNTEPLARRVGLISAPVPEPQPFVIETRTDTDQYPRIGNTPPPRGEPPMTDADVAAMDARLLAAAGARRRPRGEADY